MQRNYTHLNHHYFLSPILFCLVFISCVYFNTFYNAEISFKKALQIIEESPIIEDGELPIQAKKLLDEAIENSKLVLKEYPESKYVDDAVFIIDIQKRSSRIDFSTNISFISICSFLYCI